MVKTIGPCISLDATGSIAGAVTFQKALKSKIARRKPIPRYTRTTGQAIVRNTIKKAVYYWHQLLPLQQNIWKVTYDGYGLLGYHSFIKSFINRTNDALPQYELPPDKTYCLVGEWLVGELTVGGVWIDP